MSRVPIAVDRHNARRLASSSAKCDEPFHCWECGAACVLRQGLQRVHHFAHKAATGDTDAVGCTGGGEGVIHEACKLFIKENIGNIVFTKACAECGAEVMRWKGKDAASEQDVVANGQHYRVDLLAQRELDSTEAVIEVLHTHRCRGDKLADLASIFGDNVFEVESFDYEEATSDLPLALPCVNCPRCSSCVTRSEKEEAQRRRAAEARRVAEEQRQLAEEKAREERRIAEEQRQLAEEKAREERRIAEIRAKAEQGLGAQRVRTLKKLREAMNNACERSLSCAFGKFVINTECEFFPHWLQQGIPITCKSSGVYLLSKPEVYRCLAVNPRQWALCGICDTELAASLKQALRDVRRKRIAFPRRNLAEYIRIYLTEMRLQLPNQAARHNLHNASTSFSAKRKLEMVTGSNEGG